MVSDVTNPNAINWANQLNDPASAQMHMPNIQAGSDPNSPLPLPPGSWQLVDVWGNLIDEHGATITDQSSNPIIATHVIARGH